MIYSNCYLGDLFPFYPAAEACSLKKKGLEACLSSCAPAKKCVKRAKQETCLISIDVYETDKEYYLKADLPGIPKENIHITAEERTIHLEARPVAASPSPLANEPERQERDTNTAAASSGSSADSLPAPEYHIQERSRSTAKDTLLTRSIAFPDDADLGQTTAEYELGVLTLQIQKKRAEKKTISLA